MQSVHRDGLYLIKQSREATNSFLCVYHMPWTRSAAHANTACHNICLGTCFVLFRTHVHSDATCFAAPTRHQHIYECVRHCASLTMLPQCFTPTPGVSHAASQQSSQRCDAHAFCLCSYFMGQSSMCQQKLQCSKHVVVTALHCMHATLSYCCASWCRTTFRAVCVKCMLPCRVCAAYLQSIHATQPQQWQRGLHNRQTCASST